MPLGRRSTARRSFAKRSVRGRSGGYGRGRSVRRSYGPRAASRSRRPVRRAPARAPLTGCAALYLKSLYDPFNTRGACMPSGFAIPTAKVQYNQQVTAVTSATNANGFVFMNGHINGDDSIGTVNANIQAACRPIQYSALSTFDGYAFVNSASNSAGTADAEGVAWQHFKTGFTSAASTGTNSLLDAINGVHWRVVSAGLKIQYIGTNDNMGGTYTLCEQPNHASLVNQGYANCLKFPSSKRVPITHEPVYVCLSTPVLPGERDVGQLNTSSEFNDIHGIAKNHALGIHINSATFTQFFAVEAVLNVEIAGAGVYGMTRSVADPIGYSTVCNIVQGDISHDVVRPGHLAQAVMRAPAAAASARGESVSAPSSLSFSLGPVPRPMKASGSRPTPVRLPVAKRPSYGTDCDDDDWLCKSVGVAKSVGSGIASTAGVLKSAIGLAATGARAYRAFYGHAPFGGAGRHTPLSRIFY